MSRKAARLEAKLHRQIAEMNIHELMDLFDAPRIVISRHRKTTIPILSNLPQPISVPVKSITILLAAAESSEDTASLPKSMGRQKHAADGTGEKRLIAEAGAAVKIIAEADDSRLSRLRQRCEESKSRPKRSRPEQSGGKVFGLECRSRTVHADRRRAAETKDGTTAATKVDR